MNKKLLFSMLVIAALPFGNASEYISRQTNEKTADKDLSFLVTFDGKGVNADFAKGNKYSTTMRNESLMLRGLIGFDNKCAFKPEPVEALKFDVAKNADPHNGTLILWVSALDYNPAEATTDGKGRGNIALAHLKFQDGNRSIEYQLYEYGQNVYFDWKSSEPPHSFGSTGRVFTPRKGIKKGQWHQFACTWNSKRLAIYLNGKLMKEEALPGKVSKTLDLKVSDNADSFIGIKSPFLGDTHSRGVAIDDFAIYNRALSALEIRNQYLKLLQNKGDEKVEAYSITLNGINIGKKDKIDRLEAEFDFSSLSDEQQKLLDAGKLVMTYEMKAPDGKAENGSFTFNKPFETRIFKNINKAGLYTLTTKIGKDTVVKTVNRPDFSWVGNGYGDEDEVPALWKDFSLNGRTVKLWNRTYKFGNGPLPVEVTVYGKKLFAELPELLINGKKPVWKAGKVKKETKWITFSGTGKLGKAVINYSTRVEYDGMMLVDWAISGEPTVSDMKFTWKMAPANHQFLMTPTVNEDKNAKVAWPYPEGGRGNMLWFVSEKKGGFAFSMVNDANWVYNKGENVFFADKATGNACVKMITKKVKLPADTPYRAIFLATPTRPLPLEQRGLKFGDSRGGNTNKTMTNAGGEGGFAGIFHHAPHPEAFEAKHKDGVPNRLSVYGGIALTSLEPEAVYLRKYWEVPGAYSYNMPWHRPLGDGKYRKEYYPSLSTCTSSVVNDFFLNSQHKLYNHKLGDRIWQVYYDLCGNGLCRSKLHGCSYTDKFGREVNSYEILGERELVRRTVAYAHKHGRTVMLHGQRSYFPMIHGLADYWYPGEQYNVLLRRNAFGYTDEVSDDIYRSEFNKHVLGVGVMHLPALAQADSTYSREPAYTEAMMAMLQSHDIETNEVYTSVGVVQKVWDIMEKYGIKSPETVCRLYHEQKEVKSSQPDIRITYYKTSGSRYILFLVNKTYRGRKTTIDLNGLIPNGNFKAIEEYKGKEVEVKNGKFTISVPARSFRIVCFPPGSFYPVHDKMDVKWGSWRANSQCDSEFVSTPDGGIDNSSAIKMINKSSGGGCFMKYYTITPGKTYTFSVMAKNETAGNKMGFSIQGRKNNYFAGAKIVGKHVISNGDWQKIELTFKVPTTGKWGTCNNIVVTMSGSGKNTETIFDDFKVEEQ